MKTELGMILAEGGILQWMMGNDPERAGTPKLMWANMPESWGVFVLIAILIAIVVGVFWFYRREINTCPMSIKLVLAGLRLAVLLLLIGMFLKPSVFYQQVNEIKPTFAVLRDVSLSVGKGDQYRSPDDVKHLVAATGLGAKEIADGTVTRAELIDKAFNRDPKMVEAIRDKGALKIVDFADGTRPVAVIPAFTKQDSKPAEEETESGENEVRNDQLIREDFPEMVVNGLGTDIWQALRATLDDENRLAGVILTSDFQHNGFESPVEIAKQAAELDIPVFTIGVGDPNPPKNLSVKEVYVRSKSYPDEPFEIESVLQASQRGGAGLPAQIDVNLLQQDVDSETGKLGSPTKIKSKTVDVPENGGRIRVDFDHVLTRPGKYVYTIQTAALENETNSDDNAKLSSELEVVDEKVKVLLISGMPNWDYQQVQRLLQRDQTIALSCWLQSMDESRPQEGNEPITRLPRNIEEMGQYNVIMMIDPNPQEFDAEWIDTLEKFCRFKAGGFFFMAGPRFSSEFVTMNRLKQIRNILPVRFGDTEFIDTSQILASADNQPGRLSLVSHNMDHPAMSFKSDPAETQKIWSLMPGVYWSFPTLSAKPTARTLLERNDQTGTEGPQPLLVAGRYGAGSVLYSGFQGTWRWRKVGLQAQYFDRFWIQVVRYLVETRSLQGSRRGFVDTDKGEYELGDRIVMIGRVLSQQFQPSDAEQVEAVIRTDDGRTQKIQMKMLPQQQGRYEGTFIAQRTGNYEATIMLADDGTNEELIEPVSFRVVPPSAESGAAWLNQKLMNEIATQSGGQSFRLDQLDELAAALPRKIERAEFNSPPEPLWDINRLFRFFAFCLPVVLLSIEWSLRKWFKLL